MWHILLVLAAAAPSTADAAAPAADDTTPADALAQRLVAATGDPYALPALRFTFVVTAGDTEKARRTHTWCPQRGVVEVALPDGAARISAVDGSPLAGTTPDKAATAWQAFTNDSYWLLAPAKVLDGGVRRQLDDAGHLVLEFDGVGLTPGDRYVMTVDPADAHLTHWDFTLQSGRQGSFDWAPPVAVSGLRLSPLRTSSDGTTTIAFLDLDAPADCPLTD